MAATLHQRLGRTDGIRQLVDDAVDAHLANPLVSPRFANASDIEHAKRKSVEFFCAGAGAPRPTPAGTCSPRTGA